jgi:signal peptidase I
MAKKKKSKLRSEIEGWTKVVVVVLLIRFFVIHPFRIPSGSMQETLLIGDFLLANKFIYGLKVPWTSRWMFRFKDPQRGDIIVFRYPFEQKDFIKRCIAIEGDVVEIKDKSVYVNGERLTEPYVKYTDSKSYPAVDYAGNYQRAWMRGDFLRLPYARDNFGPVKVPEDHLFMLGDNRDNSSDSRFWGPLHIKHIKGKAMVIYFSYEPPWYNVLKNVIKNVRWKRIGDLIR